MAQENEYSARGDDQKMEKLKLQSMDKVQDNIEKIRKLFPNVVTEVIDGYVKDETGMKNQL